MIVASLAFASNTFALDVTCDYFGFPFVLGSSAQITFFDCETGQLRMYDANGSTVIPIESGKNLGGFVHKLVWSPDGNRVLILTENIAAAKQELKFYSQNRALNTLNWWLYDIQNDRAELLDGHIIDAGWISANRIIYDWDNTKLSMSDISALGTFEKVLDLPVSSVRTMTDGLYPVASGTTVVFPMKTGVYSVQENGHRSVFLPTEGSVLRVVANPFSKDDFVIQTDAGIFRLDATEGVYHRLDSVSSARDMIYYAPDALALLVGEGSVYVHDMTSGKEEALVNVTGKIGKIFSIGHEKEFLFTSGTAVFKKVGSETEVSLPGIGPEAGAIGSPIPDSSASVDPSSKSGNVSMLLFGVAMVVIILVIVLAFIAIRRRRQG
jgi:hypothetical protein